MNLPLHDSDRELWLSRYLDGELSAEEKKAVADKVRIDSVWRAEFEELKTDETLVARTIERYHAESPMAREVVRRIEKMSKSGHAKVKLARRSRRVARRSVGASFTGFLFKLTGAAALVAASIYGWRYYHAAVENQTPLMATVKTPAAVPAIASPELGNELVFTSWPDGTQIWSRRGTVIERVSDRSLQLNGEAFFHVAANPIPFTVIAPNGTQAQALGTRFDVKTGSEGARIRVAEGHVRCDAGSVKIDAYGGTEILPDLHTNIFDPRALVAEWSKFTAAPNLPAVADGLVPAWNQSGGSQGHTSITPVSGPVEIISKRELFFAPTEPANHIQSAAVISAGATPRAYVLARNAWESTRPPSEQQTTLLALELSGPHRGTWKACATFGGFVDCAPVVSPRGLVIFATPDGNLKAYDPLLDKVTWSVSVNSSVFALTAGNDETIFCSSYAGVAALDGHNGQILWHSNALQNVKAPVTVLADGTLCAVSEGGIVTHLDVRGHVIASKQWGEKLLDAPAAAVNAADAAWLNSTDGKVARISMHDGALTEKLFAKQSVYGPIGNGLVGSESGIIDFAQQQGLTSGQRETIVALAQDGRGDLFAAYKNGVLHKRGNAKEPEFVHITRGEVVRNGLSIIGGMVVVTTSQGIQVFE